MPTLARCQYANTEIWIRDYENRALKTASFYFGLLTHNSEIKNNLGIDTGIVPKFSAGLQHAKA